MNGFVQTWNRLADLWMNWILQSGVQSLLVLAIVSVLWVLIRKRASAHFGYALFLLPLVPLALPSFWSVEIPVPASSSWGQRLTLATNTEQLSFAGQVASPNRELAAAESSSPRTNEAAARTDVNALANSAPSQLQRPASEGRLFPSLSAWLLLSWILTTTGLMLRFVSIQLRTRRQVRKAVLLDSRDQQRIAALAAPIAKTRRVQVMECAGLAGPAAWGVRRPVVLFPPDMIDKLNDDQLAWVFGHELAHHTRFDLVVSTAQRLIQMAWFFNPLVWWQGRHLNHLRECACDETAQARTRIHGKSCAQALIEVVAQSPLRQTPAFALHNLHYDKKTMKLRILRLMNSKRPARAGLAPLALPLLLAAGSLCTTSLWLQNPIASQNPTPSSSTNPIAGGNEAPTPTAPSAIGLAQSWLLDQQLPDGHWPAGPGFEGPTGEFTNVGITGLVLLSLQNADASIPGHRRTKAVQQAVKFLKEPLENAQKRNRENSTFQALASHTIAIQAWLETHRDSSDTTWRVTAEKAIKILLQARNPYAGWGFEFEPNGDSNTFNTVLALRALATAKELGFKIPRDAYEGGTSWLQSMMLDKQTGRVGYSWGQSKAQDVRLISKKESHPVDFTELCTAMSILGHTALGEDITESKEMMLGVGLLAAKTPAWNVSASNVDYYYWYFGMQAMDLVGGVFEEKWRDSLQGALLPRQLGGEGLHGSFPAVDAWSDSKATVHATVMATLALQAAERTD